MKEIIGERLRRERHRRGIKQTFLAEQIGVQSATISQYERGINAPPPDVLIKFAQFYGCSTDYLLGLTDKRTPNDSPIDDEIACRIANIERLTPNAKEELLRAFSWAEFDIWKRMQQH